MFLLSLWQSLITGLQNTTVLEYVAVVSGILSVWFSRKANILVYPVGLVNTIIYTYLSFKYHLIGEAGVNFYYTVVSLYGWALWARRDVSNSPVIHIRTSTAKEVQLQVLAFSLGYVGIYLALTYLKNHFYEGVIPWADALASASAFTGMWLMAKKKVESWYWWIVTNIASIPLYFVKGLVVTSFYYVVLLVLAVAGLMAWKQKARAAE